MIVTEKLKGGHGKAQAISYSNARGQRVVFLLRKKSTMWW